MNQKLIVVLLLITIVLSITSMAIVFNIDTDVNFLRQISELSQPTNSASVGLNILEQGVSSG